MVEPNDALGRQLFDCGECLVAIDGCYDQCKRDKDTTLPAPAEVSVPVELAGHCLSALVHIVADCRKHGLPASGKDWDTRANELRAILASHAKGSEGK